MLNDLSNTNVIKDKCVWIYMTNLHWVPYCSINSRQLTVFCHLQDSVIDLLEVGVEGKTITLIESASSF